jgi:hypothetical protein
MVLKQSFPPRFLNFRRHTPLAGQQIRVDAESIANRRGE